MLIITFLVIISGSDYIMHIQYGMAGIPNFGYGAIFGISAYISAILSIRLNLSPWIMLILNLFIIPALILPLGLATLRLKHQIYFIILSLAFGEILRLSVIELEDITRGQRGLWGIPAFEIYLPVVGHVSLQHKNVFLVFSLIIVIIVLFPHIQYRSRT
jgi:branched-chain amino acid transport system permease protein